MNARHIDMIIISSWLIIRIDQSWLDLGFVGDLLVRSIDFLVGCPVISIFLIFGCFVLHYSLSNFYVFLGGWTFVDYHASGTLVWQWHWVDRVVRKEIFLSQIKRIFVPFITWLRAKKIFQNIDNERHMWDLVSRKNYIIFQLSY